MQVYTLVFLLFTYILNCEYLLGSFSEHPVYVRNIKIANYHSLSHDRFDYIIDVCHARKRCYHFSYIQVRGENLYGVDAAKRLILANNRNICCCPTSVSRK